MKTGTLKSLLLLAFLIFEMLSLGIAGPAAEREIEALLGYVGEMDGASFIRSGKRYSAKEAEAHLRMKWGKVKKKIRTADDFITHIASKSYLTGKEYRIRFEDGTEKSSGKVLAERLEKLRASGED